MNKLKKWARSFGLGRVICLIILAALVFIRIADPPALQTERDRTFDTFQNIKPRDAKLRPAVIVDIDEASLATFGQWPWPRTLLADLVTKLTKLGSAAIGFDVIFAEPDRMSPAVAAQSFRNLDDTTRAQLMKLPSNDEVLADAIRRSRVVLGESGYHLPLPQNGERPPAIGFALMGRDPRPYLFDYPGLLANVPVLEKAAAGRGLLTMRPERDGIVRHLPLVMIAQGQMMPTLTLDMLRVVTGAGAVRIKTDAAGISSIAIPGLEMPTDRHGQLYIHFAPHDSARYVSAKDVLEDRVPADRFQRRLVLIGTSAVGLRDIKATPIDPAMSGVEVHAQALESVLSKSTLVYPNWAIGAELAVMVLFGLTIIAIGPVIGALAMLLLGAIVAAALVAGSWYFFSVERILIDAKYPLAATLLIYLVLMFINYMREQLQRRRIRSAFGQYLAPSLVEQLAHSHESLTLGGEDREMTIMFSDVRGFTTISEIYKDDPQGLTTLMNNFLTPLTNAIIDHHGTIDKYIGDAIMAFWNAPLHDHEHELNACAAALDMLARVEIVNKQRKQEAEESGQRFIPIKIGVGLNSGRCVVGNMGSDLRFNYSVLGDCVNLASRLEGQSKNYDVPIVIGDKTAKAARNKFAVLELDFITVKGKTEPETIYTVLGDETVANSSQFKEVHELVVDMLRHYRKREFAAAADILTKCRETAQGLGLNKLFEMYARRIADFEQNPPPENWNGVFALDTK